MWQFGGLATMFPLPSPRSPGNVSHAVLEDGAVLKGPGRVK